MVKSIFLQDGEEIFVDDEDYGRVSQHTWHKSFNGNHRMIMNGESKHLVTFILENAFQMNKNNDFTRNNLRIDGNKMRWSKARSTSSSRYKGVSWAKDRNKWSAKIRVDGKIKSLGHYIDEDEAARVYNRAVINFLGGDGYLNVIGEDNRQTERDYKTKKGTLFRRPGKTGYRGVKRNNSTIERYSSRFDSNEPKCHFGSFDTKEQAALVYNKCVTYLCGDDAILNDVPMTDELKEFISNWEIPQKILDLKK